MRRQWAQRRHRLFHPLIIRQRKSTSLQQTIAITKSESAFFSKEAPRVKTGGPGNLTDRYVRCLHREGGQIPRTSCAHLAQFSSAPLNQTQSRGTRKSVYNFSSALPASGCQSYRHLTSGGSDIRIDSVRPPDCRPNKVPRSQTRLNST